jgi:Tfp pilus assembly protein FimT
MALKYKNIPASSLMETVVAMVIIVTVVTMCFNIFSNVIQSRKLQLRAEGRGILLSYVQNARFAQNHLSEELDERNWVIFSKVEKSDWSDGINVWIVNIQHRSEGLNIGHKELILAQHE